MCVFEHGNIDTNSVQGIKELTFQALERSIKYKNNAII